jgi:hypothetical protein
MFFLLFLLDDRRILIHNTVENFAYVIFDTDFLGTSNDKFRFLLIVWQL